VSLSITHKSLITRELWVIEKLTEGLRFKQPGPKADSGPVRNTYVAGVIVANESVGQAYAAPQNSADAASTIANVSFVPETVLESNCETGHFRPFAGKVR
jgi:hypothetical protein